MSQAAPESVDSSAVFQCQKCRTILSDSSQHVQTLKVSETRQLLAFRETAIPLNVHHEEELLTSQSGVDHGSSFLHVSCPACDTPVGRLYQSTCPALDVFRDRVTLESDCILMYRIPASAADPRPQELSTASHPESSEPLADLRDTMEKVMQLQIVFAKYMRKLRSDVRTQLSAIDGRLVQLEESVRPSKRQRYAKRFGAGSHEDDRSESSGGR